MKKNDEDRGVEHRVPEPVEGRGLDGNADSLPRASRGVPVGTEQPWSADDAVMDALLEVRGVDTPVHQMQGIAALAPTDRHHPKPRRKFTRESVLLAVGGLVLCAVALLLALGVFGGKENADQPGANGVTAIAADDEEADEIIHFPNELVGEGTHPPSDEVDRSVHPPTLSLRSFDAKRLHKDLRELRVQGHGVTDESLKAIAEACPDLEGLTLYNTDVTDRGFANNIGKLRKLARLNLSHSRRITDKGIRALLSVGVGPFGSDEETKPRDVTIPEIPSPTLPLLQELDLSGFVGQTSMGPEGLPEGYVDPYSKITDASIPTINAYQGLKRLSLSGTKVTDKGISSFLTPNWDWLGGSAPVFEWLDLSHTQTSIRAFEVPHFPKTRLLLGLSLVSTKLGAESFGALASLIGTWKFATEKGFVEVASNTAGRRLHLGGNGFVPMNLEPKQLLGLKQLGSMRELKFSWISCPKGTDWAPLGELTQLESLTLDSIRGEGNETILAAVLKLTNLQRLDITNTSNLVPMTRLPLDASEFASDNPVRKLQRLVHLRQLDFSYSSHILDSALHLLHNDLPKCRILAADGFEIQAGIVKVVVSAGRENLEGGAAVALLDKDGVVASICRQRTFSFNDLFQGFPEGFRLTSGVPPPVKLSQPCYEGVIGPTAEYRALAALPSSPIGFTDLPLREVELSEEGRKFLERLTDPAFVAGESLNRRMTQIPVTLPAYDMKRWPKKEIWGSRTPDFAVRVNDSKTKGIAAAIAISTGPIEDWILKGPGSQPGDGAHKTGAVMAVLKPIPDPQGDDGQFTHHADCEIPQGKHWLIVLCPGHKPHQREFIFEGKPIDLVIDMDEAGKPAPANAKGD